MKKHLLLMMLSSAIYTANSFAGISDKLGSHPFSQKNPKAERPSTGASTGPQSRETIIFNMSDQYDILATYRICTYDNLYNASCNGETTILINNKKSSDKNYVIITLPSQDSEMVSLDILSAIEKDNNNNIVAQQNYVDDEGYSYCGTERIPYGSVSAMLELNDMHESPYITCHLSFSMPHIDSGSGV